MVLTPKFAGLLNRHYIFTLLNDADQGVITPWISADSAEIFFGDISALNTELHSLFNCAKDIN